MNLLLKIWKFNMYKKLLILILLSPTFAFASQTGGGVLPYES